MKSQEIRKSVMKDYDLIANNYCDEYGIELDDKKIIDKFKNLLEHNSKIVDLGGGSGKVTNYLIENNYNAVCYDFSKEMMNNALKLFPKIPYILDDIVNINNHFNLETVDGVIALYSLFHIPKENMNTVLKNINNILKDNGYFLVTFQLGNDESFVDEPYLKETGKNVLYMNYYSKKDLEKLFTENNFKIIYKEIKKEIGNNTIGNNDTIIIIAKKVLPKVD